MFCLGWGVCISDAYVFIKLSCRVSKMKRDLEERGVAVVPGVIEPHECDQYIEELRSWLTTFDGDGRFPDNMHSIIHGYGIAHHSAVWKARLKV